MNAPFSRELPEHIRQALETVTLDDKYSLDHGRAFMSGVQALVKLPMLQRQRDALQGKRTAGFISGVPRVTAGGLRPGTAKSRAAPEGAAHRVPARRERRAGRHRAVGHTATGFFPTRHQPFRRACSASGTARDRAWTVAPTCSNTRTWLAPRRGGGVIAVAGDDHIAKSSTAAHQSDHIFKACGLPVFFPTSVQEILDLGLHALAMSRFSGVWAGMKTIQEIVESSATAEIDPERVNIVLPDFPMPPGGLHIRWPDTALEQEARLMDHKWYAALAYVRANRLNHNVIEGHNDRFGIISSGKAYNDTRQALQDLGLDTATCQRIGLRLHKVAVVWPLEAQTTREFATGLREILVVEEKRQVIEYQLKEELYNWRGDVRPHRAGQVQRGGRRFHRRRMEHAQPQRQHAVARQRRPVACADCPRHRPAAEKTGCARRRGRAHGCPPGRAGRQGTRHARAEPDQRR
jgi:indolepyruvate ferredoxin oxidoreductase